MITVESTLGCDYNSRELRLQLHRRGRVIRRTVRDEKIILKSNKTGTHEHLVVEGLLGFHTR